MTTPQTPDVYISIMLAVFSGILGALAAFVYLKYRMKQAATPATTPTTDSPQDKLAVLIKKELERNTKIIEDRISDRISLIIDSSQHKILLAVKEEIENSQKMAIQPIWEELQGHRGKISDLSERVARLEESKKASPRQYGKR